MAKALKNEFFVDKNGHIAKAEFLKVNNNTTIYSLKHEKKGLIDSGKTRTKNGAIRSIRMNHKDLVLKG